MSRNRVAPIKEITLPKMKLMGAVLGSKIGETFTRQEICGNRIKAGFFNVIINDIAVHGTNEKNK